MLSIRYGKPNKQILTNESAYVSFEYDPYYVNHIKELPCRYYDPNTKEWEIPTSSIIDLYSFCETIYFTNQSAISNIKIDPSEFKIKPMQHQIEALYYGLSKNSWLLGDEQGLGKTKEMIDLAVWKKHHQQIKHCLIICGINNLKYNWVEEIKKHSNEICCILGKRFVKPNYEPSSLNKLEDLKSCPEEFFWITNIESLRCHKEGRYYKSEFVDTINKLIESGQLNLVVIDEIHKCKNPTSAQGRGLLKIKDCPIIGLSGTLLVSKPLDLYVPLRLIQATNINYFQFTNKYVIFNEWHAPVGYKNTKDLQELLNKNMLRRTKDILDLPPKIHKDEYLEMSKEERKLYEEILNETKQECDKIKSPTSILAKITRLRQVCCHTGLVSTKIYKSSKFERLRDILEEARDNNQKVIVFSMFRELIELAVKEFEQYNPLHIWGSMKAEELTEQKDKFQNEKGFKVLFGVIQAAGTGITLNEANIVVFLDLPWDKATMEQAEDRAHRIGTKKTVTIISLLMKDSYDEILRKIVLEKDAYGKILVDGKDPKLFRNFIRKIFREGDDINESNI